MKYGLEKFTPGTLDELVPLADVHITEVGPFQFDYNVDWERYIEMEDAGILKLFVARHNDAMIGYVIFVLSYHVHFSTTLMAMQDALYVSPEYRGQGAGTGLMNESERVLKELGANAIIHPVTPELDFSPMLADRGYSLLETLYVKTLEEMH